MSFSSSFFFISKLSTSEQFWTNDIHTIERKKFFFFLLLFPKKVPRRIGDQGHFCQEVFLCVFYFLGKFKIYNPVKMQTNVFCFRHYSADQVHRQRWLLTLLLVVSQLKLRYSTLSKGLCTLYTVQLHFTLYTLQFTLYTLRCALYTVHFTLYTVHYILYTIHCTLYTVHCTLYTTPGPLSTQAQVLVQYCQL